MLTIEKAILDSISRLVFNRLESHVSSLTKMRELAIIGGIAIAYVIIPLFLISEFNVPLRMKPVLDFGNP